MDTRSVPCTPLDADWPHRLRGLSPPPERVYVRGRLPRGRNVWIAVVGSREADRHALTVTARLVESLAGQDVVIVSGGARGVDGMGHAAALNAGLDTVAVLAGGLDRPGPASNRPLFDRILRGGGALLSEIADGVRPGRGAFPRRNRLIAALSDITIVVSAAEPSGSLHTARWAGRLGRPVFAIPGDVTATLSRGCNRLISRGEARLLFDPAQLPGLVPHPALAWPPGGARIGSPPSAWTAPLEEIVDRGEVGSNACLENHLDGNPRAAAEVAASCRKSLSEVQAMLQRGCLLGTIQRVPGNRYILVSRL